MKLQTYGKINLGLNILGKRIDGYHNIKTIMINMDLFDIMSFKKIESGLILKSNSIDLSLGKDNLIYKSWECLCEYVGKNLGVEIYLDKRLPIAAGIAGGTSNGAAVLQALNSLYELGLSSLELKKLGVKLGADFPFCLYGRPALCQGIGELITPLTIPNLDLVIVNPGFGISTKEAYENYTSTGCEMDIDDIEKVLNSGEYTKLNGLINNDMENYAFKKHPKLDGISKDLYDQGAEFAGMSGSGPTFYGIFANRERAVRAYEELKNCYCYCRYTTTLGGMK